MVIKIIVAKAIQPYTQHNRQIIFHLALRILWVKFTAPNMEYPYYQIEGVRLIFNIRRTKLFKKMLRLRIGKVRAANSHLEGQKQKRSYWKRIRQKARAEYEKEIYAATEI